MAEQLPSMHEALHSIPECCGKEEGCVWGSERYSVEVLDGETSSRALRNG